MRRAWLAAGAVHDDTQNPPSCLYPARTALVFFYAFLTNSDFNCIAPIPSILQSIL